LRDNSWTTHAIPANFLKQRWYPGVVFNSDRNSFMYFGGHSYTIPRESVPYMTEYSIDTGKWSVFVSAMCDS
jgi:hypothetical protein